MVFLASKPKMNKTYPRRTEANKIKRGAIEQCVRTVQRQTPHPPNGTSEIVSKLGTKSAASLHSSHLVNSQEQKRTDKDKTRAKTDKLVSKATSNSRRLILSTALWSWSSWWSWRRKSLDANCPAMTSCAPRCSGNFLSPGFAAWASVAPRGPTGAAPPNCG